MFTSYDKLIVHWYDTIDHISLYDLDNLKLVEGHPMKL